MVGYKILKKATRQAQSEHLNTHLYKQLRALKH